MNQENRPMISAILELIGGYFGILGIGWMVAGDVLRGIIFLVCYAIFLSILGFLTFITAGLFACIAGPIYIAVPIASAIYAYRFAEDNRRW
ncbi:MAG: hypothetical protein AAF485_07695 [Chloroflexota bacterium]